VSTRALTGVMLGCLAVGLIAMLVFDHALARVVGVLALFAFIVTGVFLIADPAFLAEEDDGS
jgi:uncharacterized membrane protein YkgB